MISDALRKLLGQSTLVLKLMWLALTASIFLYVLASWMSIGAGAAEWRGTSAAGPMPIVLGVLALSDAALSFYAYTFLLAPTRLAKRLAKNTSPEKIATNRETGVVDPARADRIRALDPQEQPLAALPAKLFAPYIIVWSLNESVAIFGLVLAFTTDTVYFILPFAAVAVLLNLAMYPRIDALAERVKRAL